MYLSTVFGSKSARIVTLFTLLAVIISLLPVVTFAQEVPAETVVPQGVVETQTVSVKVYCQDDGALNYEEEGDCKYESKTSTTTPAPTGACEIEGHKYDATGSPLSGWAIGLMKVITFADDVQTADLDEKTTDDDGYYCLEWDGYTGTQVIDEPHSFKYRVYEVLKAGWNYLSVEQGADADNLNVVADDDILVENGRVSVQIGEENGYIYTDAEHHVDFYNTEVDPCVEITDNTAKVLLVTAEDPCDEAGGGDNDNDNDNDSDNDNDGNNSNRSGNGGTRLNRAPVGEVLGASTTTPAGMVLGEATSTLPVGAPNTGAGGTATPSVSFNTLVAILGTSVRRIK